MSVDRFGNLITNIPVPPSFSPRDVVRMVAVGNVMVFHVVQTYQEAPDNTPCMVRGSSGLLEVVVKNGSASTLLRAHDRTPLRVVWR
jgi:S-adenosylmethionine hydrolase